MTTRDIIGLVLSYAYATGLLVLVEVIRRWRGYPQDFTRKIVHIGAGMWVFGVLSLFDTWYVGVIPFATFIGLNYLFYRFRLFEAIDAQDSTPGTVYFAFSITLLFLFFWRTGVPSDKAAIAAAGTMAMTWGDSLAAIIGKRWGRRRYTVLGSTRSWEGSVVMFGAAFVVMLPTLLLVPGSVFSPFALQLELFQCLAAALLAALVATLAEALSPWGTDNLSVPLLAGVTIYGVLLALG
jgi:phytol kinase